MTDNRPTLQAAISAPNFRDACPPDKDAYIDHVDIVVDAPSWSDPAVSGSRALGLRLLARSNESNHARTAVA